MSTLSNRSDQEISALLDDYGIKHGPIVGQYNRLMLICGLPQGVVYSYWILIYVLLRLTTDSTRSLYEKKILQAMGNKEKARPSSDKTFYREEGKLLLDRCPYVNISMS